MDWKERMCYFILSNDHSVTIGMVRFRFGILVDVIDLELQSIMLELSDDIGQ